MHNLKDPVIPPEGYDRCGRCNRLVKIENMREDEEGCRYGPGCYRWMQQATPEEIRRDTIRRSVV
jgi:hypothetical protein